MIRLPGMPWAASLLIARIDDYLIETSITTVLAFGSYLLAERLQFSGVLAVVAAGTNRLIYTKSFSQTQVQAGPSSAALDMVFTISNLSTGTAAQDVRFNSNDTMPPNPLICRRAMS